MTGEGFKLYKEHSSAPFPDGYTGVEVKGVELVELDTYTTGCICSYFNSNGSTNKLNYDTLRILKSCQTDLATVITELEDYPKTYFQRLKQIVDLILAANK